LDVAKRNGLLNLKILAFRVAAYNTKLQKMDYFNPENKGDYNMISGSKMRELARTGESPPVGFMDPKGWEVLATYYKSLK
jgi:3'-phosphoadenosine 5'-phosphosulfate synthase